MSVLLALQTAFDEAFMAAIRQPQPLIVIYKPQIVAGGMTPPNIVQK